MQLSVPLLNLPAQPKPLPLELGSKEQFHSAHKSSSSVYGTVDFLEKIYGNVLSRDGAKFSIFPFAACLSTAKVEHLDCFLPWHRQPDGPQQQHGGKCNCSTSWCAYLISLSQGSLVVVV